MAQYTINHTCGHQTIANITGTDVHGERTRRADFLASRPCPACRRAEELSAATAQTANLPTLFGSDKQVAWATTIRAQDMSSPDERIAKRAGGLEREAALLPAQCAAQLAFSAEFRAAAAAETSAKNWIDGRGTLGLRHDEQLGDLVDAQLAEIQPLAEAAGMTVTEYVRSGQAARDQADPQLVSGQRVPPPVQAKTDAEEFPVQEAELDAAAADKFAETAIMRVKSWWEPADIAALPAEIEGGKSWALRGLVEDVISADPRRYGDGATERVLSVVTENLAAERTAMNA